MELRSWHAHVLLLAGTMLGGCADAAREGQNPPASWVEEVVAADAVFGGGDALELRLLVDPNHCMAGDPLCRQTFLRQQCELHDRMAADLVREFVSEDLARAVMPFLRSDAGNAFVQAEVFTLATYWHHADGFPQQTAAAFANTDNVGDQARAKFAQVQEALVGGASVSPPAISLVIGGMRLTPEHADAIGEFFATDVGRRWLAVRTSAFPRTQRRFHAFLDEARARGFVTQDPGELEDLILPIQKQGGTDASGESSRGK